MIINVASKNEIEMIKKTTLFTLDCTFSRVRRTILAAIENEGIRKRHHRSLP
jgi:ribosome biogenesis protein Tsr3